MIPLTLSRLLDRSRPPDHPLALRRGTVLTCARFAADVAGVAARLRRDRVRRAAVLCADTYAFAVALYALVGVEADVVFPSNGLPGTLDALRDTFDVLVDDAFVAAAEPAEAMAAPLDIERPALSFFTSGSTGAPKRIVRSLAAFEREAEALEALFGASSGSGPVLAMVPHAHVYGLTFKVTWPLASGRPFAAETYDTWEALLADLPPGAIVVSSPAFLSRCGGLPPVPAERRPARVFTAGAPLSLAAAVEAGTVLGVRPTEIFGSTETGAFATRCQSREDEPWRLLPGVSMRCDEDGRLSLFSAAIGPEWYRSADIVEPIDGGFRFRGRADRIVKIEGKRVSLAAVEQSLARLPWVESAAAVLIPGAPDRLGAALVLSDSGRERLSSLGAFRFGRLLRDALSGEHEAAASPRLWRFVDELPTGELGKRRDADLRRLFES
ncbi:MAG: AMP-binding protein [Gemmatimonas sp.]